MPQPTEKSLTRLMPQSLPLTGAQPVEHARKFAQRRAIFVCAVDRRLRRVVHIREIPLITHFADEMVHHDPMHLCGEVGARCERISCRQDLQRDVLGQIVRCRLVPRQRKCPNHHFRPERNQLVLNDAHRLFRRPVWLCEMGTWPSRLIGQVE
jgi:hypothetical protein